MENLTLFELVEIAKIRLENLKGKTKYRPLECKNSLQLVDDVIIEIKKRLEIKEE